ncbi:MAG TPA: hypothetical protein VG826_36305 [Pirellulales bacterium]|nr:hypothetical protein [Pirellulales bacterium]
MKEIKATYRRSARDQAPVLPFYDTDLRELSVTGEVILRLPVQARSLAAALTALQAAGWKARVPKPLACRPGGNDPHHLAIAAYKLNDRQELIDFHADDGALRWNWRVRLASRRFDTTQQTGQVG